jgi:hypothetical protein
VVRLWDPRAETALCKLPGHTDTIRALVLSDDGMLVRSSTHTEREREREREMRYCRGVVKPVVLTRIT